MDSDSPTSFKREILACVPFLVFKGKLKHPPLSAFAPGMSPLHSEAEPPSLQLTKTNQEGSQGHFKNLLSLNTHQTQSQEIYLDGTNSQPQTQNMSLFS